MSYGEDYFLKGVGSHYKDNVLPYTPENYLPYALERAKYLKATFKPRTVLDVGCARGFLVSQLRALGVKATGIDKSKWAIKHCVPTIKNHVGVADVEQELKMRKFDLVVADDLLEHVEPDITVKNLCNLAKRFIAVRVCVKDAGVDKTHKTILKQERWTHRFSQLGWKQTYEKVEFHTNGNTVAEIHFEPYLDKKIFSREPNYVILIPTWNVEATLDLCLAYLRQLDPPPRKIIFCENNSDDMTPRIIENLVIYEKHSDLSEKYEVITFKVDPNIFDYPKTHRQTVIAMARQRLLERARELDPDYAIYIDADILVLTHNVLYHLRRREADILGAPYLRIWPNNQLLLGSVWFKPDGNYLSPPTSMESLTQPDATSGGFLALSRKVLQDDKLNFYPIHDDIVEMPPMISEDFAYCVKAKKLGYKIYLDHTIHVHHLIRESIRDKPWSVKNDQLIKFKYGEKK